MHTTLENPVNSQTFLLLGTAGCHLCEEAENIINECVQFALNIQIESIDIALNEHWQKDYASSIPVLFHEATQQKLLWPFTHDQVINFLKTIKT